MTYLNKYNTPSICILIMFCISGCSTIFENDIESEPVTLMAPCDGLRTSIVLQTFWWYYVKDATNYNLQIVSPNFDYVEKLVLDTILSVNKFQITLNPGTYQWRVNAFNSGYSTQYTTNTIYIDTTLSISIYTLPILKKE